MLQGSIAPSSVGTEHTAIARLGAQEFAATGAFIKIPSCIDRHNLGFRRVAGGARDRRILNQSSLPLS